MDETKENEIKPDTADCQVQETAVQRRKRETLLREQTPDALWEAILAFEGAIFYTATTFSATGARICAIVPVPL